MQLPIESRYIDVDLWASTFPPLSEIDRISPIIQEKQNLPLSEVCWGWWLEAVVWVDTQYSPHGPEQLGGQSWMGLVMPAGSSDCPSLPAGDKSVDTAHSKAVILSRLLREAFCHDQSVWCCFCWQVHRVNAMWCKMPDSGMVTEQGKSIVWSLCVDLIRSFSKWNVTILSLTAWHTGKRHWTRVLTGGSKAAS